MPTGIYDHKNCHSNKGVIRTKEWRKNYGKSMKGKNKGIKQWKWKGDKVSYAPLHQWVARWKGKPNHCEVCGITEKRFYDWANVDHKYRRVLEDYISMCRPCHRKYDKEQKAKIIQDKE